ncbi:hypothetical protein CCB80_01200 [Armatimonadetes bacterium Uphvl-Ar1]|nr:hypothetical protein CCB80_01200 [Armatimonadetes bacterium Uphvl-Ar1]
MNTLPHPLPSTLQDISFMVGTWHGRGAEGWVEEIWGQPTGNNLTAIFRHHLDGKVIRFELVAFTDEKGYVEATVRFFKGDLSDPAGQPEPCRFFLHELTENSMSLFTDDLSEGAYVKYQRDGDTLRSAMTIGEPCGEQFTFKFHPAPKSSLDLSYF